MRSIVFKGLDVHIRNVLKAYESRTRFFRRLHPEARVLDIGCGEGCNAITLKNMYPAMEVHGVDIVPGHEVSSAVSYKMLDLDNSTLPYPDEYFDAITCTHVFEHLQRPLALGGDINRILKQGGMLYLEVPNWTSVLVPSFGFMREQHGPFNFYDDPTHIKPWSKHGIYEFISQQCGFFVENVGAVRNWLRLPFDPVIIILGLVTMNRSYVVSSFWNLYGWSIYGVGIKKTTGV